MTNFRKFALATALATLTAGAAQATPVQWSVDDGGNGHWYDFVVDSHVVWADASATAISSTHMGEAGYLATITSAAEQGFLNTLNPSNINAWLGGFDRVVEGRWEWITGESFDYTNFAPGEPNDWRIGEDYLAGWWNGDGWNDLYHNAWWHVGAYVVEYNSSTVAPIPLPAGLPLVLGALGLLGFAGRRRKAS